MTRIICVGYEIPGFTEDAQAFSSDQSLLDADIVLFNPTLAEYSAESSYLGKRRLYESDSARAVEDSRRWRSELAEAVKAGKTVIVYLSPHEEVYVHLGQKQTSGTGRNQKVTLIVEPLTNYSCLPFDLGTIVPKGGREIRAVADLKWLAPYWTEFGAQSPYKVYLKGPKGTPVLPTTAADAVVGLVIKSGKGTVVLVPPVQYDRDQFVATNKKGEAHWTKEAMAFGARLANAFIELDRAARAEFEVTPAPSWTNDPRFAVPSEAAIEGNMAAIDASIQELRAKRERLQSEAAAAGAIRDLLFESGKPLERAVLRALKALGFQAEQLREGQSEFDAVFISSEGRCIGEAEGKNDKAIAIEKLDQLERNIREDFDRPGTTEYAKGVLFGNAFRLRAPAERSDYFTQKCLSAAARSSIALVRTPNLFEIVRYLEQTPNPEYATACRAAIFAASGTVVTFPPIPPVARAAVEAV